MPENFHQNFPKMILGKNKDLSITIEGRLEELTALVPKPYSVLYIYLLNPQDEMFHIRFERRFQVGAPP